jgi:hypothetical protein
MSSYAPGTVLPGPHAKGLGATARRDAWWLAPLGFFALLMGFLVYSTLAALFGAGAYWVGGTNYLTPFYSPELWHPVGLPSPHAWFGPADWWPLSFLSFTPALLILGVPAGFRLTCYYYRKVYYRSFWADPVACAVGEPRHSYLGENSLPLILWNAHRFLLYLAILVTAVLAYDGAIAWFFPLNADGSAFTKEQFLAGQTATQTGFGLGLGALILSLNAVFLAGYTFGCHSFRHLIGGRTDSFGAPGSVKYRLWSAVTWLNEHHPRWAMISLCWVLLSDVYIRLMAIYGWTDHIILVSF